MLIEITHHSALPGLANDDHTQYLLANGSRALAGAWNMGSQELTNVKLKDTVVWQGAAKELDASSSSSNVRVNNAGGFIFTSASGPGNDILKIMPGMVTVTGGLRLDGDLLLSNGGSLGAVGNASLIQLIGSTSTVLIDGGLNIGSGVFIVDIDIPAITLNTGATGVVDIQEDSELNEQPAATFFKSVNDDGENPTVEIWGYKTGDTGKYCSLWVEGVGRFNFGGTVSAFQFQKDLQIAASTQATLRLGGGSYLGERDAITGTAKRWQNYAVLTQTDSTVYAGAAHYTSFADRTRDWHSIAGGRGGTGVSPKTDDVHLYLHANGDPGTAANNETLELYHNAIDGYVKSNFGNLQLTPASGSVVSINSSSIVSGSLYLTEKTEGASIAGFGQLWCLDNAGTTELWFTDDNGNDTQLA